METENRSMTGHIFARERGYGRRRHVKNFHNRNTNIQVEIDMKRLLVPTLYSRYQDIYFCQNQVMDIIPPFQVVFSEKKMNGTLLAVADEEGAISFISTAKNNPEKRDLQKHQLLEHGMFRYVTCNCELELNLCIMYRETYFQMGSTPKCHI